MKMLIDVFSQVNIPSVWVELSLPGKTMGVGEIKALTTSFTIEGSELMKLTSCSNAPKCLACK